MSAFDERWRLLAAQAQRTLPCALPADLASRARARPLEPRPLLQPRAVRALSAAAALLTAAVTPLLLSERGEWLDASMPALRVPAPPRLPSPPDLEAPAHYVTLARDAWKELVP